MSQWPPRFQAYGVTLEPLAEPQLELVRHWRNDPAIAELMLDTRHISAEQQRQWFAGLTGDRQRAYWVAHFKDEPIGVASLVNIDDERLTAEPGMYIYSPQYRGNIVPFCVAFALNDLAFEQLGLDVLNATVLPDNQAALRFNEKLGYQRTASESYSGPVQLTLNVDNYQRARALIARFIRY